MTSESRESGNVITPGSRERRSISLVKVSAVNAPIAPATEVLRENACQSYIRVGRVYDERGPRDQLRVLVDRLWPRGLSKTRADLDEWCTPSRLALKVVIGTGQGCTTTGCCSPRSPARRPQLLSAELTKVRGLRTFTNSEHQKPTRGSSSAVLLTVIKYECPSLGGGLWSGLTINARRARRTISKPCLGRG